MQDLLSLGGLGTNEQYLKLQPSPGPSSAPEWVQQKVGKGQQRRGKVGKLEDGEQK